jgi:hypothetical protein
MCLAFEECWIANYVMTQTVVLFEVSHLLWLNINTDAGIRP